MNKVLIVMCVAVLFVLTGMSYAQEAVSNTEARRISTPGQPIVFGSKTIFNVNNIQGYSAQERARTITNRINTVAGNLLIDTTSIKTSTYDQPITLISAGNELLMVVFEEDAKAAGLSRHELASDWSARLSAAIGTYRQEHTMKWIMAGVVTSLIATMILVLVFLVLNRGHRKAVTALHAWIDRKKVSIHIQSLELMTPERIEGILSGLLGAIRLLLMLIVLYGYSHVVLKSFPWTSAYASQILHFVIRPFQVIGGAVWLHVPNLFLVVIIAGLAYYAVKLLSFFFTEVEKGTITLQGFHTEWSLPTYKICRALVIVVAAIMAFPYIPGSSSPAFKGISLFLGVLLSLGSSSAVSNILAGYTLIYRRVFKVGDRVKIADFTGDVMEMRLQVTHLRTIKNEEIVVPSSMIINSHVINYSSLARQQGLILHTAVTIGYDTPWRQVHALLLLAAERTQGLLREPVPFVLQTSLDDFYVSYELNAYTDNPLTMIEVYSDLHKNIQDAFNEYGVQIMSPSYRFDPDRPKIVPKEQWYAAPAETPDAGYRKD
jgi:small-conductance mechanosensitive channel